MHPTDHVPLPAGPASARVSGLDHYTIRCGVAELERLQAFYMRHLGVRPGPRPDLPFPGCWLYADGRPIIHLYAIASADAGQTGSLDHVALRGIDLQATRAALLADGIPFEEIPVPGWPIHQIFLRDPAGLKIELSFVLGPLPPFVDP